MNPSEQGFLLEEIIHNAVNHFSVLAQNMRETQIKQHFQDNSLNGVDHWIKFGKNNVLIQDKWKEDTSQQEVSQFLECANRINRRIPRDENIYLLWVSKYGPTKNSMMSLNERGVELISCSISVQTLARLAILRIAECLDVDPVSALLSIPIDYRPVPIQRASVIMDEEAMEILKIRKELNEKKRLEEEDRKAKEAQIRKLLKEDKAFSWKARVSPDNQTFYYAHNNGTGELYTWNSSNMDTSVKNMLGHHIELTEFRESMLRAVPNKIKDWMQVYWQQTDKEILNLPAGGRGSWGWPHEATDYIVNSFVPNDGTIKCGTHPMYWKAVVIREIAEPIIKEEYEKYLCFCEKFIERNKDKPALHEALEKIDLLEKQVSILQKNNDMLEEKLSSIRKAMSI